MKEYIAAFINMHAEEIDKNEFLPVYLAASSHFSLITDIGLLTEMFEEVGLNPLEYMTLVPMFYFSGSRQAELAVRSDSIKVIYDYAFKLCLDLESVSIPNTIKRISPAAFEDCPKLKYIQYEGTYEEFMQMKFNYRQLLEEHPNLKILCTQTGEVIQY